MEADGDMEGQHKITTLSIKINTEYNKKTPSEFLEGLGGYLRIYIYMYIHIHTYTYE